MYQDGSIYILLVQLKIITDQWADERIYQIRLVYWHKQQPGEQTERFFK